MSRGTTALTAALGLLLGLLLGGCHTASSSTTAKPTTPTPAATTATSMALPATTVTIAPSTTPPAAAAWQPLEPGLDQLLTPAGVVLRMDPRLLEIALVPGTEEPGGTFPEGGMVPLDRRAALVAVTNAGFKRADARGGEMVDGRTIGSLAPGAASLVITRDGAVDIGAWSAPVGPGATPDTVAVLQNLTLLVDHRRPAADLGTDIIQRWGVSFRPALPVAVWRSGAGIDDHGRLLYATGANIVPAQLAQLLITGGAVRGMQLDINHLWVFAALFSRPDPQHPEQVEARLVLPGMGPVPGHVLAPGPRDFLAVYRRPRSNPSRT